MADNYLENKFEELKNKPVKKKASVSLSTLLRQNRSYRGYDKSCIVTQAQLRRMAEDQRRRHGQDEGVPDPGF